LCQFVSEEYDGVKAFENHADLWCGEPPVGATYWNQLKLNFLSQYPKPKSKSWGRIQMFGIIGGIQKEQTLKARYWEGTFGEAVFELFHFDLC
jgi:hypothetical protein